VSRLRSAMRLEVVLAVRQRFLHAAVFSGLIWLAVLLPMPHGLRPVAEPYILLGDIAIIGFFFIGASVFFERQERTLGAVVATPLSFWEYLTAKIIVLVGVSAFVAVVVATVAHGVAYRPLPMVTGVVLGTVVMLLVGFATAMPFSSASDWFISGTVPLAVMTGLPVLYLSGVWASPVLYALPTLGPLLLLGSAFDQIDLAPWQTAYAVGYPIVAATVLGAVCRALFERHVVVRA
jgi:fluoroquinolone transport system permease protein